MDDLNNFNYDQLIEDLLVSRAKWMMEELGLQTPEVAKRLSTIAPNNVLSL